MGDAEMRLFVVATEAASIAGALAHLRESRLDRALETLEQQLDTATIMLSEISSELPTPDRERAIEALRLIREYRQLHPRRAEFDMSKFDQTLVQEAHKLQERARRILEEIG